MFRSIIIYSCIFCTATGCYTTFEVQAYEYVYEKKILKTERVVEFGEAQFRVDELVHGHALELVLTGLGIRNEIENRQVSLRFRPAGKLTDENGLYRVNDRRLLKSASRSIAIGEYLRNQLLYFVPSLGTSGLVALADAVTLPVRLLMASGFSRTEIRAEKEVLSSRSEGIDTGGTKVECFGRSFEFTGGRVRIPFQFLLAGNPWTRREYCLISGTPGKPIKHPLNWPKYGNRSPIVDRHFRVNQKVILFHMIELLREMEEPNVSRGSRGQDLFFLVKMLRPPAPVGKIREIAGRMMVGPQYSAPARNLLFALRQEAEMALAGM